METTIPQKENTENQTSVSIYVFLTMVATLIFIGIGLLLGFFIWGNKNNQKNTQTADGPITPMPTDIQWLLGNQSQSSDNATANWTVYTDVNFSVKYPTTWLLKKGFTQASDLVIYDPKSIKQVTQNGAQIRIPTAYVDILSVASSSQSAAQTVSDFTNTMKQKNTVIQSEESPVYKSDMVLFDSPGQTGKNIIWSHNNTQAMFSTSIKHLTDDSIENHILQTFQFIPQQ